MDIQYVGICFFAAIADLARSATQSWSTPITYIVKIKKGNRLGKGFTPMTSENTMPLKLRRALINCKDHYLQINKGKCFSTPPVLW